MNAPVTSERKSFLPSRLRSTTTIIGSTSNIPTASHPTTPVTKSMSLNVQNDTSKSVSLTLGSRVLFNDLKIGTLRYIGTVEFAQGIFCGIELDEPEGKHDGQVNNIRYFQCKTDHGIFVPREKVILAPRERTNTIQRSIGPLKYPAIKRTMTMSSSINNINNNNEQISTKHPAIKRTMTMSSSSTSINNINNNNEQTPRKPSALKRTMTISSSVNDNKNEQIPIKSSPKMTQLPDIIPNSSTSTQPVSIIKTNNNPIITEHDEIITPTENIHSMTSIQSLTIDEISETIVPDFTDSVSVLLHHLQPDEQLFPIQTRPSITISEEGTIDDDDDDDQSDVESINESILSEKLSLSSINNSTKSIQTDLSIDINENLKNLLNSTTSMNECKINSVEYRNKEKPNLPIPSIKKILPERKLSISSDKTAIPSRKTSLPITNTSRKLSLTPPKPVGSTLIKPKPSLGSQSKLNRSFSSSTSVASSQSDLTTSPIKFSEISHLDKKLDPQLIIQKAVIQSLESNNEYLKKQYQHLLNQFDLMYTLNQYYINQNEQIKQEYEIKYSKFRIKMNQLKILIEQLKFSHENELEKLNEQNKNTIKSIKQTHQQETLKYQQELKQSLNEKLEFETRCIALQKEVDRYMYEMENSEYADPLLRRVEILEKDRTSLETVLELRTQELTQLRTQMNEQVFVREDQLALQKRLDMAENRNQDLICLLRNWQLNELSVGVQCEQLKEQLTQLERDNRQLTFENETLLYTLRQRSPTISDNSFSAIIAQSKLPRPTRAHSFSCLIPSIETNPIKYSSSLDCILNR